MYVYTYKHMRTITIRGFKHREFEDGRNWMEETKGRNAIVL